MKLKHTLLATAGMGLATLAMLPAANAQLRDVFQAPNTVNEGIHKNFATQIGAGRGDALTQTSSLYIIRRDPFRAIRRGRQIFQRKFLLKDGFGDERREGQIAVDAKVGAGVVDSCAGCHGRPRGSAGHGGDVFTRPDSRDAPHLFGLGLQEMLGDEITTDLRAIRTEALATARSTNAAQTRTLSSKGINYGTIVANPNQTLITTGVQGVDADLRVRPFFAQGGTISIREFVVGAFKAEMGLEAPDTDLATASGGGRVTTPAGMILDGRLDRIEAPPVTSASQDGDGDSKTNEIPLSIVDFMEFYLLNYFKPATGNQTTEAQAGRALLTTVGCTTCHIPNLTINHDRRVADVETVFDPVAGGPFNQLFATATGLFTAVNDGTANPPLKNPTGGSFVVRNFFADLKRHDLGPNFRERNFDGTFQNQFMTEPLWGVATTAPYGHDGRSNNLEQVILRHGGEAQASRDAFAALSRANKMLIFEFLSTLVLFPPDDTSSNLLPANPAAANFPQAGHGAISLTVLFNTPSDIE